MFLFFSCSVSSSTSSSSRTEKQSRHRSESTSSTPWCPNPPHPGTLHLPSPLHGPSHSSSDHHLAGNRRSRSRQFKLRPDSTSLWNFIVRPPFSPPNGSNRL